MLKYLAEKKSVLVTGVGRSLFLFAVASVPDENTSPDTLTKVLTLEEFPI